MSIDIALAAAGGIALAAWTGASYSLQALLLVLSSLAMAGASLWSCRTLLGQRSAWTLAAIAIALGWFAEEMGSTRGWFFASTRREKSGGMVSTPLTSPSRKSVRARP